MHVNLVARSLEEEAIGAVMFTEHMKAPDRSEALSSFQDDPSISEQAARLDHECNHRSFIYFHLSMRHMPYDETRLTSYRKSITSTSFQT